MLDLGLLVKRQYGKQKEADTIRIGGHGGFPKQGENDHSPQTQ